MSERLLHEAGSWLTVNNHHFTSITTALAPPAPSSSPSIKKGAPPPRRVESSYILGAFEETDHMHPQETNTSKSHAEVVDGFYLPRLGCGIALQVTIYEIALSLDVENINSPPSSASKMFSSSELASQSPSPVPLKNGSTASNCAFLFTTRGVEFDTTMGNPLLEKIDASNVTDGIQREDAQFEGSWRHDARTQARTHIRTERFADWSFAIQSVDFEHVHAPSSALRRLLATVNKATPSEMHPNESYNHFSTSTSRASMGFGASMPNSSVNLGAATNHNWDSSIPLGPLHPFQVRGEDSYEAPRYHPDAFGDSATPNTFPSGAQQSSFAGNKPSVESTVLVCRGSVTNDVRIDVHAELANVQVTMLTDAIIALVELGAAIHKAAFNGMNTGTAEAESSTTSPTEHIDADLFSVASTPICSNNIAPKSLSPTAPGLVPRSTLHRAHEKVGETIQQLSPRPQPLSVPLSSIESGTSASQSSLNAPVGTGGKNSSSQLASLSEILLQRSSFALPVPLRGLSASFFIRSCGVWIPSNDKDLTATAAHASLNAEGLIGFHDISWEKLLLSREPLTESVFTARLGLSGVQVCLSKVKYGEIYTNILPVVPLSVESSSMYEGAPLGNASTGTGAQESHRAYSMKSKKSASQKVARVQKPYLLPFGGEFAYAVYVTSNRA
jgi:hypothetical protein